MLFPDLGDALIPLTEDILDNVGYWPANHAHGSIPGCRGHLANYRAREGGKKKKAQGFEPVRQCVVCAVKCGGAPPQPAPAVSVLPILTLESVELIILNTRGPRDQSLKVGSCFIFTQ